MRTFLEITKSVARRLAIETAACVLFLALTGVLPALANPQLQASAAAWFQE